MKSNLLSCTLLVVGISFHACSQEKPVDYPVYVGDVEYDPAQDDVGFRLCNGNYIAQYYNFGKGMQFSGEKSKIVAHFQTHYHATEFSGVSGYVRIRFIVNCDGMAGRFRVEEMDLNLEAKPLEKNVAKSLLAITTRLQGWTIAMHENRSFDYYQYLVFKIEDGKLTEILP